MMYYLKVNKSYLDAVIDADISQLLGYTDQYKYIDRLMNFEYEGQLVKYIESSDGEHIIIRMRLPSPFHKEDEEGVIYDRSENHCLQGQIQNEWKWFCIGRFGMNNISTKIEALL